MDLKTKVIAMAALFPTIVCGQGIFDQCRYTPNSTEYRVVASDTAGNVILRLYDGADGGQPLRTVKMKCKGRNLFTATVPGDQKGLFYTFDIGCGETPGVFAKAVGLNGKRGCVVDMRETDPEGWSGDKRPLLKSPADLVIYEMHHRDFSVSPESGMENKGKFIALAEPAAISHLKSLGVNAVHILPSFDFATIDEAKPDTPQYNWGYDPLNYNVPEGSYSTNAADPKSRIREFKRMVMALHKAGIRVILDVVYNHTNDIEHGNFQRTYPDYYYRKTADGKFSNGSACGNETASEKPLMRHFMIESVKHWINEYHVDGFRFDLMGMHDIPTMNAIRKAVDKIDPSIYIYGEGWSAGNCALPLEKLAMKANTRMLHGIGAFSDELRDALRGPFNDNSKGAFLAGIPGSEESVKFGIVGAVEHPQVDYSKVNYSKSAWASEPTQMVSYVSCHDDMCLVDRLKASIPGVSEEEVARLGMLAQTAVFTSQGIPFMLSGEEMLRDKKGVHNSYKSPDSVNQLPWENLGKFPWVFDYYKGLIALRAHHPAFRLEKAELVRKHLEFLDTRPCLVAFRLAGHAGGDAWGEIVVALNGANEVRQLDLPSDGIYTVVCRNGVIDEGGLGIVHGGSVEVGPRSALVMHR